MIYKLGYGDQVKVQFNRDGTSYIHSDNDHDVHFTGRRLAPLPNEWSVITIFRKNLVIIMKTNQIYVYFSSKIKAVRSNHRPVIFWLVGGLHSSFYLLLQFHEMSLQWNLHKKFLLFFGTSDLGWPMNITVQLIKIWCSVLFRVSKKAWYGQLWSSSYLIDVGVSWHSN